MGLGFIYGPFMGSGLRAYTCLPGVGVSHDYDYDRGNSGVGLGFGVLLALPGSQANRASFLHSTPRGL